MLMTAKRDPLETTEARRAPTIKLIYETPVCPVHNLAMVTYATNRHQRKRYFKCPHEDCRERDQAVIKDTIA